MLENNNTKIDIVEVDQTKYSFFEQLLNMDSETIKSECMNKAFHVKDNGDPLIVFTNYGCYEIEFYSFKKIKSKITDVQYFINNGSFSLIGSAAVKGNVFDQNFIVSQNLGNSIPISTINLKQDVCDNKFYIELGKKLFDIYPDIFNQRSSTFSIDMKYNTPIINAIWCANIDFFNRMIDLYDTDNNKYNIDFNMKDKRGGKTALMSTIMKGYNNEAKKLIERSDLSVVDDEGRNALYYAKLFKNEEIYNMLLKKDKTLLNDRVKGLVDFMEGKNVDSPELYIKDIDILKMINYDGLQKCDDFETISKRYKENAKNTFMFIQNRCKNLLSLVERQKNRSDSRDQSRPQ